MCGYRAANAVAKELSGERGFDEYTKWWQESFDIIFITEKMEKS